MEHPILSLCLPTNGIIEWVFPVLDSIYSQDVDNSLFEVVVTNNGDNDKFDKMMMNYAGIHSNLIYKKTDAYMFYNQLEALKLASGTYLKFVNHRAAFTKGALKKMIDVIQINKEEKPVIYFGNGVFEEDSYELQSFDDFVRTLRRYASWTTGVGIWKEDYDKIPEDVKIDKISPHSCILFSERNKSSYLIENFEFSREVDTDHSKKGTYDLFRAFAVEEITITLNLFIDGNITAKTFKAVKSDYKEFVADLFLTYVIRKKPCSYDLSGFDDAMGIFFTKKEIIARVITLFFQKAANRVVKGIRK